MSDANEHHRDTKSVGDQSRVGEAADEPNGNLPPSVQPPSSSQGQETKRSLDEFKDVPQFAAVTRLFQIFSGTADRLIRYDSQETEGELRRDLGLDKQKREARAEFYIPYDLTDEEPFKPWGAFVEGAAKPVFGSLIFGALCLISTITSISERGSSQWISPEGEFGPCSALFMLFLLMGMIAGAIDDRSVARMRRKPAANLWAAINCTAVAFPLMWSSLIVVVFALEIACFIVPYGAVATVDFFIAMMFGFCLAKVYCLWLRYDGN